MNKRTNRRNWLAVERLEDRSIPATAAYSAGTLTLTAATGDQLQVAAKSLAGNNTLPGYLDVKVNGTSLFASAAGQKVSGLVVKAGSAQSFALTIGQNVTLTNLKVAGAPQSTSVVLQPSARVNGNLTFTGHVSGLGDDFVAFIGSTVDGNVNLALKSGANKLMLDGAVIGGSVAMTAGAGSDTVLFAATAAVEIQGKVAFALGGGTNAVKGASSRSITIGQSLAVASAPGANDTIDFRTLGSTLTVGGDLTAILRGTESKWQSAKLHSGGNVLITSGVGNDSVTLSGPTTIAKSLAIRAGGGSNSLGVEDARITGGLSYFGGAGIDHVQVSQLSVGRDMSISLGAGTDMQAITCGSPAGNSTVAVAGNLSIQSLAPTGAYLKRLRVCGNFLVATGAGNDSIFLDDSDINGNTTLRLGAGDDGFQVETFDDFSMFGVVRFGGDLTVQSGDGGDLVRLWTLGGEYVLVGGNVLLNGGRGADTFGHNSASNFYLGHTTEDFELGVNF